MEKHEIKKWEPSDDMPAPIKAVQEQWRTRAPNPSIRLLTTGLNINEVQGTAISLSRKLKW